MSRKASRVFRLNEYCYPKRLNWKQIIDDIKKHLTRLEICELMGISISSLQRIEKSKEPKDSKALAILTIHIRYCGEELTQQRIEEAE